MLGPPPPSPFDPSPLRVAADLRRRGIEPEDSGYLPVRHGIWIPKGVWTSLSYDHRYAAFVHGTAVSCDPSKPPLFSHESAAVLWGLPRIEPWPKTCHVTYVGRQVRSSGLIQRHTSERADERRLHGLRVTSPAKTIVDLCATGSWPTALAAADHALRHELCTHAELIAEVGNLEAGSPGIVMARLVRDLADPLSMSPGESLSRAQMFVLNIPRPRLQISHEDGVGLIGVVDFDWSGVVGEFGRCQAV